MNFTFFVINDNNDALHFHIEPTCMKDWRLRYSAMKSTHRRYLKGRGPHRGYFSLFEGDYSCHVTDKQNLDLNQIADHVQHLIDERRARFAGHKPCVPSTTVTFPSAMSQLIASAMKLPPDRERNC